MLVGEWRSRQSYIVTLLHKVTESGSLHGGVWPRAAGSLRSADRGAATGADVRANVSGELSS